MATFIGLGTALIVMTSSIQYFAISEDNALEGWDTIGGLDFNHWAPAAGYAVTPNDTQIDQHALSNPFHLFQDHYNTPSYYYSFATPYGSGHAIRVFVTRNSTNFEPGSSYWWEQNENFFTITRLTNQWPWPQTRHATVPFEDILRNVGTQGLDDNSSQVSFMLGKLNATLFIHAETNLEARLYANDNYTISIGTPLGENLASNSMWTVLGQILTLRLPDTHPAIKLALAIPMWAGIGFMAVTFISRFIPLIGGG